MKATIELVKQLKQRILRSRYLIAKIANAESLRLYFTIGHDLDSEINKNAWGDKILASVSARLQQELPGLRGFSSSNIRKMRMFYIAWNQSVAIGSSLTDKFENTNFEEILPTLSDKLNQLESNEKSNENKALLMERFFSISFSHHYEIILKTTDEKDRWYYINQSASNFWTVRHLRTELARSRKRPRLWFYI